MTNNDQRVCPAGCPHMDPGADPWGCDECRLEDDREDARLRAGEETNDEEAIRQWTKGR